jgi:glucose-6-phosphate dehydrogenase assembly protein OpcA
MTNPEGTPLGGMAVAVDVTGIEKELASLWRAQSKERAQALTRACSWNLIIHCADEAAAAEAKKTADALVRSVPTRTIIVTNQPYSSGQEIEAWVSANCHVGAGGGKLLCTEEIHIHSRGRGVEHVPSLLRALLVPDVPTALWWHGEPPDNVAALRLLLSGVDRLIVDTAGTGGALSRLAHVGGLLDRLLITDLNWLRTGTLRSVLASLFDPPAGHLPLFHVRRVHAQVDDRGMAAARLMIAWLTSRLKWTVQERIPRTAGASWRLLSRDESPIAVDIDVGAGCARASGLQSLVLEGVDGVRYGFVARERGVVDTLGPPPLAREVGAVEPPTEQLLVAALGGRGRDRLYGVALHRAVDLEQ